MRLRFAARPLLWLTLWPPAARLVRRVSGERGVECPCCGLVVKHFASLNFPNRSCWVCGSLERERAVRLYLSRRPDMLRPGMRVLHVAPEPALRSALQSQPGVEYRSGDLFARLGPERLDVTQLGTFSDAYFDIVVCNHVLEHVPDDRGAMRELRRVLKPSGWALLLVPDLELHQRRDTDEEPGIDDPAEQERRFGQFDHVRRYGWDYVDRLGEAGFAVEVVEPSQEFTTRDIARFRLAKRGRPEPLFVCRPRD